MDLGLDFGRIIGFLRGGFLTLLMVVVALFPILKLSTS